jgi:hypothetical protein
MILTAVIASFNAMCWTSSYCSSNVGNKFTTQKPEVSIMTCVQNAQLDGCTLGQVGAHGAIPFPHQSRRTGFNPWYQPMWRNDYSVPQLGSEPSLQIRKFGGCFISYTSCSIFEVRDRFVSAFERRFGQSECASPVLTAQPSVRVLHVTIKHLDFRLSSSHIIALATGYHRNRTLVHQSLPHTRRL